jgi:hypothetical protein
MNLHEEFYAFRDKVWRELERQVHEGTQTHGEFPICIGDYSLPPNGLREHSVGLTDTTSIHIIGIQPDPDYAIFPPKESERDIHVTTNRITVLIQKWSPEDKKNYTFELNVEPDILDLQTLSTYLSGGWSCYTNQ